jgi:hypothetical protein
VRSFAIAGLSPLGRKYAVEPLGHTVGHGRYRDRREQGGNPGELVIETGAAITVGQVRGDPGTPAAGDESRTELG